MSRMAVAIDSKESERRELEGLAARRRTAEGLAQRARIALLAADGWTTRTLPCGQRLRPTPLGMAAAVSRPSHHGRSDGRASTGKRRATDRR
jgi:hypothetical protein